MNDEEVESELIKRGIDNSVDVKRKLLEVLVNDEYQKKISVRDAIELMSMTDIQQELEKRKIPTDSDSQESELRHKLLLTLENNEIGKQERHSKEDDDLFGEPVHSTHKPPLCLQEAEKEKQLKKQEIQKKEQKKDAYWNYLIVAFIGVVYFYDFIFPSKIKEDQAQNISDNETATPDNESPEN